MCRHASPLRRGSTVSCPEPDDARLTAHLLGCVECRSFAEEAGLLPPRSGLRRSSGPRPRPPCSCPTVAPCARSACRAPPPRSRSSSWRRAPPSSSAARWARPAPLRRRLRRPRPRHPEQRLRPAAPVGDAGLASEPVPTRTGRLQAVGVRRLPSRRGWHFPPQLTKLRRRRHTIVTERLFSEAWERAGAAVVKKPRRTPNGGNRAANASGSLRKRLPPFCSWGGVPHRDDQGRRHRSGVNTCCGPVRPKSWAQVPRTTAGREAKSVLVFGMEQDIVGFNTAISAENAYWAAITGNTPILRGAYIIDQNANYHLDLASSVTATKSTLTITIRPDAYWYWGSHAKTPVTNQDVLYTWQQIMNPNNDVSCRGPGTTRSRATS